jgi:hypothetical protein
LSRRSVAAVVVLALSAAAAGASAGARAAQSPFVPRLTTRVPPFVTRLCAGVRHAPLPVVCPPLVPVTQYRRFPGLSGVLVGSTGIPPVRPPADAIYLLGFNGGDSGPVYWHWLAGMGTPGAIRYWVLSDARNEVKGRPRRVAVRRLAGRRVEIWRFPDYPAGGEFGGHVAAITPSGPYLAIASVHGSDTADVDARMAVALARKADAGRRARPRRRAAAKPPFVS